MPDDFVVYNNFVGSGQDVEVLPHCFYGMAAMTMM
jgi:hypothetical protein